MANPGYPQPAAPRPKARNRGCAIALYVLAGFGLLLLLGLGIGSYLLWQNEDVRRVVSAAGEGVDIMRDAQKAPGTAEVRALGCQEALALDLERAAKLAERFTDAGTGIRPELLGTMVMCSVRKSSGAPSCARVAKTYFGAVPKPARNVAVVVQIQGQDRAECTELYDPDGSSLGTFDPSTAPPLPTVEP